MQHSPRFMFAVTITPCPHRKIGTKRYKDMTRKEQIMIHDNLMIEAKGVFVDDYVISYEVCPTSAQIHSHLTVFMKAELIPPFIQYIVHEIGYSNKTSNDDHYILVKPLPTELDYKRWIDYMYKEIEVKTIKENI